MAKRYKLSEGLFDKFWQLFSSKKTPTQLQNVIDKDPVLLKLQKQFNDLNSVGVEYLTNLKMYIEIIRRRKN